MQINPLEKDENRMFEGSCSILTFIWDLNTLRFECIWVLIKLEKNYYCVYKAALMLYKVMLYLIEVSVNSTVLKLTLVGR